MALKEPEKPMVKQKERAKNKEKLNWYVPSYLHKKYPNANTFNMTQEIKPTIKKRTN